jgi:major intracellular serine protease
MKLLDYNIDGFIDEVTQINEDTFKFLRLTGKDALISQGYDGDGIVVAVIDTGVSREHEELKGRVLPGINTNSSYNSELKKMTTCAEDDNGHGTHVAATIAGASCGIAPKAKILPIKVLDGMGGADVPMDIAKGIRKALEWKGANGETVDIISMSLGGTVGQLGQSTVDSMRNYIQAAVAKDIIVIVSAGNTGQEERNRYPGCFEDVVTVGAVDKDKGLAMFSTIGEQVDVCQIGVNVTSAWYQGGYATMSGTSMSTPMVSGIAALLASMYKKKYGTRISERKLYEALKLSTKDLGIEGVDKMFGAGFCTLQPLNVRLELQIGAEYALLNGNRIELEPDTFTFANGRNYMSIRRLADLLGVSCIWDQEEKTAILEA